MTTTPGPPPEPLSAQSALPRPTDPVVVRGPLDLVALVPIVLGFHPEESVVLLTFGSAASRDTWHARVDLPPDPGDHEEAIAELLHAVRLHRPEQVAVVVVSDDVEGSRLMGATVLGALVEEGCSVIDVVRADGERWYLPLEDDHGGTAYDLATHPLTARRVLEGRQVHRDRAALAASLVGPADDEDAAAVALSASRQLTLLAEAALTPAGSARVGAHGYLRDEAVWLARRLRELRAEPRRPSAGEAGRMVALVSFVCVRDVAWAEMTRGSAVGDVATWTDLVRRAPRDLVPGAAAVLGFAAWLSGDGALAWCAVDRCREVEPRNTLADLVADLLHHAVPPKRWSPPEADQLPFIGAVGEGHGR